MLICEAELSIQAINLVRFVLRSFPHDEELQTLHFPVILAGIVDLMNVGHML